MMGNGKGIISRTDPNCSINGKFDAVSEPNLSLAHSSIKPTIIQC
jgi:hypothetical protein